MKCSVDAPGDDKPDIAAALRWIEQLACEALQRPLPIYSPQAIARLVQELADRQDAEVRDCWKVGR